MARSPRIEYNDAVYHVLSRGNERGNIFIDDRDRECFLSKLEELVSRFLFRIHAYVLMSNHFHLLLTTPQGNLVRGMHWFLTSYTVYFNRKHSRSGHLFQGRYKCIIIENANYLLELSRYIHLNPSRAGIVKDPFGYKWSSYREYAGKRPRLNWLDKEGILMQFGGNAHKKRYRGFVLAGIDFEEVYWDRFRRQVVLGGEEFREKIVDLIRKKGGSNEYSIRKELLRFPSVCTVLDVVKDIIGKKELTKRDEGIAIYIIRQICGLTLQEIGNYFQADYKAISIRCKRVKERMGRDKEFKELVTKILQLVRDRGYPIEIDVKSKNSIPAR